MKFLRTLLAVLVGLFIFTLGSFFIGSLIISSFSTDKPIVMKEGTLLHLKLSGPIMERSIEDPLNDLPMFAGQRTIGLVQIHEAIMNAKDDEKIKGIILEGEIIGGGFAKTEQIRNDLLEFKESGKFVIAYSNLLTEGAYYLASAADKVFMDPEGFFEFNGISSNPVFFKSMLEKLKIEAQIFRVGEFKGAVEPFFRKDLSEENEFQIRELITSINNNMISKIAESRNLGFEYVKNISDSMKAYNGDEAVRLGLLDSLLYKDEFNLYLKEKMNLESVKDIETVSFSDYKKTFSNFVMSDNEIAVIIGEGEIYTEADQNSISGKRYAKAIRKARLDEDVKAIVLRINSPGGQLQGADMIWREVIEAKKVKPVIASFSDVAASGGYYMAMGADAILAEPTTITGSIGIFGVIFNVGEMMSDKLGITTDEVSTGAYSGIMNFTRPLNEGEKMLFTKNIEKGYETFTTKAAEGRNMELSELEKLASGRIWSGQAALDNGLIDKYGGLFDAIDIAAEKAELDDFKVKYYPKKKTVLEELLNESGSVETKILHSELGEYYSYLKSIRNMAKNQGIMARLPFELNMK